MEKKKLAATLLLVAMMLSVLGYAYAAWTDLVYITGYVEMGSMTLAYNYRIEPPTCQEYYIDPDTGEKLLGEWKGKDVAQSSAEYDTATLVVDPHTGKDGYKKLDINIINAYPQLYVHTTFVVHNIGTVPIMLGKFVITGEKTDSDGNFECYLLWDDLGGGLGDIYEDVNGNGVVDDEDINVINIQVVDGFPIQLEPCVPNKMEIDLDFKQEAQECHHYYLHILLWGIQWNKWEEFDNYFP